MKSKTVMIIIALTLVSALSATSFKAGGVYTAWAQSQQAFTFNAESYNHNYIVQMLRFNLTGSSNENLKFVTRFDIAQGWWGVDNAMRTINRLDNRGKSALFDFKDKNYLMHVDQAFVDFTPPNHPFNLKIGRQWFGLGNKIMMDNNYEGIQLNWQNLTLGWAKVSEGADNTTDEGAYNGDSDLYTANFANKVDNLKYKAFGFYYNENVTDEDTTAYIVDDLQFFRNKDAATVTQLMAGGISGTYKTGKLALDFEVDILTGKDEINDLDLSGYNLYTKLNYALNDKLKVGGIIGLGSGDDASEAGFTNVNKLRTSGFFYITEVWEDSIMPDEEGITPQGLGAPNVKGYRELENTTIFQAFTDYKLQQNTSLFLSASVIRASSEIKGDDGSLASDLGTEVDFRLKHNVYKNLFFMLRGGYFIPGDAAGYLINGNNTNTDPAYELKGMVVYKF